jgi:hypothetical protein
MALPLDLLLKDHAPNRPPVQIEVHTADRPLIVETCEGAIRTRPGRADRPDAVLSGAPPVVIAVLTGKLSLAQARAQGAIFEGSVKALRRIQPDA